MKRLLLAAAVLVLVSSSARATPITVLSGGCGTATPHTGQDVVFVDTSGNQCSSATLSGGTITANSTATASATPTAVLAGTGKALNESLFSGLFVELEQAGTLVSSTAPLYVATPSTTQVTGTITNTQSVTLVPAPGMSCFGYEISGTWTGVIVPQAQAVSGGSWSTSTAVPFTTGVAATAFAANSAGQGNIAGITGIRFTGSSVASGTATVTLTAGPGVCTIMQDNGNFSVNVAQVNGSTVPVGAGVVGASGTQRVAVAQDATTVAGSTPNPCQANTLLYAPISQTGNTRYITAVSAKKNYICSIMLVAADAENVSLVGGTGSTCGTNTEAVIGGATAANGPNLAANGGFVVGSSMAPIAAGATTNEDVCLFQSGSGRIGGVLTYVQQ